MSLGFSRPLVNGRVVRNDSAESRQNGLGTQSPVAAHVIERLAGTTGVKSELIEHSSRSRMFDDPIGNAGIQVTIHFPIVAANSVKQRAMGSRQIALARVYDLPASDDRYRILVDRLWPRGVKKESLQLDYWAKELAPSNELRRWFAHDAARWDEFCRRYREELRAKASDLVAVMETAGDTPILLVYAAKDEHHNHAIVLKSFMQSIRK